MIATVDRIRYYRSCVQDVLRRTKGNKGRVFCGCHQITMFWVLKKGNNVPALFGYLRTTIFRRAISQLESQTNRAILGFGVQRRWRRAPLRRNEPLWGQPSFVIWTIRLRVQVMLQLHIYAGRIDLCYCATTLDYNDDINVEIMNREVGMGSLGCAASQHRVCALVTGLHRLWSCRPSHRFV